ncbi:MAG TPA: alpha-(1-_3)-arabinofuranosyltransferase family protein, partial [Acidimicrobiales bacterium]|nr:alpha-(1->3)-arabinofuranosyltransferase family protein [Acidimicrobiales bacterium]
MEHLAVALLAWPAQLLTRPGVFTSDTKSYLYIDPGRYLRQSASMWDPSVGLGTVTHQQIGYLFPMGPFFWATHALGVPTWVAQRLWVGAILFAAGAGVLWLCRVLGVSGPGRPVAAVAYMLSPYVLQYLGHISVILLAFAALPWLLALVERAMGRGGWRWPALVALVVAAMGSVNASSAVYVAAGPLVWVLYALATRLHSGRAVAAAVGRIVLLGVLVSSWWVVALAVEGGYGLDVLRYTETVQAVSTTSLSSEVVRGLGYWYFYGGDNFGPWISATPQFTEEVWLLGLGYALPLLGVAGAFLARWRHRAAFVVMAALGMVLAVGAYPYTDPSPVGRLLRTFFTDSTVGMALRSTDRATPLVLLSLAVLAGAGVTALWRRAPVAGWVLAGAAVAVAAAANPALWDGATIPSSFAEAPVASYQQTAAAALNRGGSSAVLGVPGQPFAATFAGMSVDPLWPGLLTRPFVTREQQVMGSLATEDLLYGLDDPIQSGVADPAAIAPLARLMGVGDVLVQNDLAFTRYDQPDPALLWHGLTAGPVAGLGAPRGFGPVRPALTRGRVIDPQTYTLPASTAPMPSVAVVPVAGTRPLVRAETASGA